MLRLATLGRLELLRDGSPLEPVPLQPKRLAMLTYLALAAPAGVQRRDTLLALFWPERAHLEARRALRQALYHLRNVLGDGVLLSRSHEEVGLAAGRLWCDAQALEAALDAGRAREALTLYRGEFLQGVFVSEGSPEWEEWVSRTRQRLRARVVAAAWEVAEQEGRAGNLMGALDAARRARELDPDDEPGLRRLMRILDQLGHRAGALRAYLDFARRVRDEYGAEPSAETRALADALRGGRVDRTRLPRPFIDRRLPVPATLPPPPPRGGGVALGVAMAALGAIAGLWLGRPGDRL